MGLSTGLSSGRPRGPAGVRVSDEAGKVVRRDGASQRLRCRFKLKPASGPVAVYRPQHRTVRGTSPLTWSARLLRHPQPKEATPCHFLFDLLTTTVDLPIFRISRCRSRRQQRPWQWTLCCSPQRTRETWQRRRETSQRQQNAYEAYASIRLESFTGTYILQGRDAVATGVQVEDAQRGCSDIGCPMWLAEHRLEGGSSPAVQRLTLPCSDSIERSTKLDAMCLRGVKLTLCPPKFVSMVSSALTKVSTPPPPRVRRSPSTKTFAAR